MFKSKRLTYANVAATLALVFSMSGGALAASKYLITSTKQISPKVIKKLKGKRGRVGPTGATGKTGAQGSQGPTGPTGPAGSAVAYAYVQGTAKPASFTSAKNISSVSRITSGGVEQAGEYCITIAVPFQNVSGAVTDLEFGGGNGVTVSADTAIVPILVAANDCPAGTSIVVVTGTEKETRDANFWISFN